MRLLEKRLLDGVCFFVKNNLFLEFRFFIFLFFHNLL